MISLRIRRILLVGSRPRFRRNTHHAPSNKNSKDHSQTEHTRDNHLETIHGVGQ